MDNSFINYLMTLVFWGIILAYLAYYFYNKYFYYVDFKKEIIPEILMTDKMKHDYMANNSMDWCPNIEGEKCGRPGCSVKYN
jgi:hypothetical protein